MKSAFRNIVFFVLAVFAVVLMINSCRREKTTEKNIEKRKEYKLTVQVKNIRKTTIKFTYSDSSIAYLRGWKNYAYFMLSRNKSLMNDTAGKIKPLEYQQSVYSSRLWVLTRDADNNITAEEIDLNKPADCKCGKYLCAGSLSNFDCFTDSYNQDRYPCPLSYPCCPECKGCEQDCLIPAPEDFCSFMESTCDKWFPVSGEIKTVTCGTKFLCEAFK